MLPSVVRDGKGNSWSVRHGAKGGAGFRTFDRGVPIDREVIVFERQGTKDRVDVLVAIGTADKLSEDALRAALETKIAERAD